MNLLRAGCAILVLFAAAAGCSSSGIEVARDAGVNRVFANVRGVT